MYFRVAAVLVAISLVLATGMASSVTYLCLMDGQTRTTCCCSASRAEAADEGAKVERDHRCCEVRVSALAQSPATTQHGVQHDAQPLVLLASQSQALDVPPLTSRDRVVPVGARAPPRGTGARIFVLNCRYLI